MLVRIHARLRIACHEAGHVIASWWSGRVLSVSEAVVVPGRGGFIRNHYLVLCDDTLTSIWARAVVYLAGIAAEFRYGIRVPARSVATDLLRAHGEAVALARRCDVYAALPAPTDGRSQIARMFVEEPGKAEQHVLEAAYLKAAALLAVYRSEHACVALALCLCRRLDDTELRLVCGPRQFDRVFVMRRRRWAGARAALGLVRILARRALARARRLCIESRVA
jgi:hypothetical protein